MRIGVLVALVVALVSGAAFGAKFTFKPTDGDIQMARTLKVGQEARAHSSMPIPPAQPFTRQLRGGGERTIYPGLIVTSKQIGSTKVTRIDTLIGVRPVTRWEKFKVPAAAAK